MGIHGSRRSKRETVSSVSSLRHERTQRSFDVGGPVSDPKSASASNHGQSSADDDYRPKQDDNKERKITDEDIAKYMAKKAQKKLAKVAKRLNLHGYAYNDSNLDERFVWKKKIERDIAQGVPLETFSLKSERKRKREIIAEIEKVKKRRELRVIEKALREEEIALFGRDGARAEFQDWEKKEAEFQFEQSKIRKEIRLREGRMKPIDILANQLHPSNDLDTDVNEPYLMLKGLTVKEMEELQEEIRLYLDFDKERTMHKQYWEALLVLCDWELAEVRKKDAVDRANGEQLPLELIVEDRRMHSSIETEVKSLLQGQTYGELEALQSKIEAWMLSGSAKVVEYWEAVLKRLPVFKAKAFLKDIRAKMLLESLQQLEKPPEKVCSSKPDGEYTDHGWMDANVVPLKPILEEEDRAILEREHEAILEERRLKQIALRPTPSEDDLVKKALKAMGEMEEGDSIFGLNDEINLDSQVPRWNDKYCPRKPKYFNRVRTGYEWNEYNQTHYDHENPPKTVQGYKFNIFYPNVVDKSRVPTYIIEKDGDSTETCIIRFHAAAPYEDIAFCIVNKEWEFSHKKGFKCTFERGILQLYLNLKRYQYRS